MPRTSRRNRALRERQRAQATRVFRAAAQAASAASRAVASLWGDLLAVLRTTRGVHEDYHRALAVLRRVGSATAGVLRDRLAALYRLGYTGAAKGVADVLPGRRVVAVLGEQRQRGLAENAGRAPRIFPAGVSRSGPAQLTEAVDLAALLLPAPDYDAVTAWLDQFVCPLDYFLIGTDSDKRMPEQLAHQIASGMSQGKTQREIAKGIRPLLDGSRVRAARAARTFGVYVAHQGQKDAWQGLGNDLIGYEVIHTEVPDSRPWHTARAGRKYYFDPGPGQDGMAQCPHPPLEPDDPSERPAGAPKIAWNCLCALVPILRE